jgi:glycerate 2-kinase
MRAIAAPASLKEVLSAVAAAEALAAGLRAGGAEAIAVPVADGGEGTLDVLGGDPRDVVVSAPLGGRVRARWSLRDDGTAVVESAQALGFHTVSELDAVRASSRGLGELIVAAAPEAQSLLVCLGGTVTVDGGAGMREVLNELPLPTRVACDV